MIFDNNIPSEGEWFKVLGYSEKDFQKMVGKLKHE